MGFYIMASHYSAHSCEQPPYLHSFLTPVRKPVQLQLSSSDLLFVPKDNISIGTGAFSVAASTLWNMLSSSVKSVENIAQFHCHLKHTFNNRAYPP